MPFPRRHQFRALQKKCGDEHSELLLNRDVRWLGHATFLTRFREFLPQVCSYLQTRGDLYQQLNHQDWLLDFR